MLVVRMWPLSGGTCLKGLRSGDWVWLLPGTSQKGRSDTACMSQPSTSPLATTLHLLRHERGTESLRARQMWKKEQQEERTVNLQSLKWQQTVGLCQSQSEPACDGFQREPALSTHNGTFQNRIEWVQGSVWVSHPAWPRQASSTATLQSYLLGEWPWNTPERVKGNEWQPFGMIYNVEPCSETRTWWMMLKVGD